MGEKLELASRDDADMGSDGKQLEDNNDGRSLKRGFVVAGDRHSI